MADSPPPETLAWLRHAASCGQRDAQLTLHILERLEALERRPVPTPEPAPVATDQELADCYADAAKVAILNRRDYDKALTPADVLKAQIRALYNFGRQHGAAQPLAAQPAPVAADCSALDARVWAYIGKQAMCGDPAATALIDLLNEPSAPQPTPPAGPAGGLVERVADAIGDAAARLYDDLPTADLNRIDARAAIREVAAWLRQRTGTIANGSQWADMIEQEAN
jgi:hypothetical protein